MKTQALLGPLITAVLLAALALTAGAYTVDANERERVQQTRLHLTQLARLLDAQERPEHASGDLLTPQPRDPWGNPIISRPLEDGGFELTSSGPDAQAGTEDDITMRF